MLEEYLEGVTVNSIEINGAKNILIFNTPNGKIFLYSEGDCCSTSWFNDILHIDNLLGQEIYYVIEKELPVVEKSSHTLIQAYGVTLQTIKGYCDIIFRNDSNGYYGGWINVFDNMEDVKKTFNDNFYQENFVEGYFRTLTRDLEG